MIYRSFDVVSVPFPFTDKAKKKKRPALVLSSNKWFNEPAGHSVMAMITSAKNDPWPLDIKISDLKKAGLPAESVVRMKLFTLDHRFVIHRIGTFGESDRKAVTGSIYKLLEDF